MLDESTLKLQDEEYVKEYMATQSGLKEALGSSLAASFQPWAESDHEDQLLQYAVRSAMIEAVGPEAIPIVASGTPKIKAEADAHRERGMCRTTIDLCSGKLAGKPRRHVLLMVGRFHVAPMIDLLQV
jgi:hypothetical protein